MCESDEMLCRRWQGLLDTLYEESPGTLVERLQPEFVSIDRQAGAAIIRFPTEGWMRNPRGDVHGGILASVADTAMGLLLRVLLDDFVGGPTVSLNINYLRPAMVGERLCVLCESHKLGRHVCFLQCRGYGEETPERALFEAQGSFFLPDKQDKEK